MTPRERADAIVQTRDIGWHALRDLIQGHIEEAERVALIVAEARIKVLEDALRDTTEHLCAGIQENGGDHEQPPEPATAWDAEAVTHVVFNRSLLPAEPRAEATP